MAKAKTNKFFNDWQALAAKPVDSNAKKIDEKVVEPYRVKRPTGTYLSMYPSDEGEKYAFAIVPDENGRSFIMTEIMTLKRFKFRNPKTNEDYFENLKLPMQPELLFDMSVLDVDKPTEEQLKVISDIKRHADLVQRYKNLYWCKVENVNLGYAKNPTKYNNRLRKEALTGFFGVPTKWKGVENTERDFSVKFIQSRHSAFQEKFRTLLQQTAVTHDELMPTWYEDYFSTQGEVKGVVDVELGSMKVGGKGATVKLVKLGKDPIEDKGIGVSGAILPADIKALEGDDNKLSHLHYYMGFDSRENLWQDMYVERFEEAVLDLEDHVETVKLKNVEDNLSESDDTATAAGPATNGNTPF